MVIIIYNCIGRVRSDNRLTDCSKYSPLMSTPTRRRPNRWAAMQVVAVPLNGSRTVVGIDGASHPHVDRNPRVCVAGLS